MLEKIEVYVDGSCRYLNGHSGPGKWAYCVSPKYGDACVINTVAEDTTANVMEYMAIIAALKDLKPLCDKLIVYTDSQLAVRQIQGVYEVRNRRLQGLHQQVRSLLRPRDKIIWIPRRKNLADKLFKEGLK